MFYTLHRLVKGFFGLLVLAGLVWLWQQREALEPVRVWYDVYENGGIEKTERLPVMRGEGLLVMDGHTFQMKSQGKLYSVRLTGLEILEPPFSADDLLREKRLREILKERVVGREVQVDVTYSNLNSILGVVYTGSTNLNTWYIANGLSRFNRDYIKSAPRDLQYKFFAAGRAYEKKRGDLVAMQNE